MSAEEKEQLLARLVETHQSVLATLAHVDLEMPVYKDSGWRVREILGHIATWDREATKSLRAHLAGTEYVIPHLGEDEGDYNEKAVLEQRKFTTQQIMDEFENAFNELRDAVVDFSADWFPGDMKYPWGESGSIAQLVEFMIEHAVEHQDEISKAR